MISIRALRAFSVCLSLAGLPNWGETFDTDSPRLVSRFVRGRRCRRTVRRGRHPRIRASAALA
jgi:hypothetical protein